MGAGNVPLAKRRIGQLAGGEGIEQASGKGRKPQIARRMHIAPGLFSTSGPKAIAGEQEGAVATEHKGGQQQQVAGRYEAKDGLERNG